MPLRFPSRRLLQFWWRLNHRESQRLTLWCNSAVALTRKDVGEQTDNEHPRSGPTRRADRSRRIVKNVLTQRPTIFSCDRKKFQFERTDRQFACQRNTKKNGSSSKEEIVDQLVVEPNKSMVLKRSRHKNKNNLSYAEDNHQTIPMSLQNKNHQMFSRKIKKNI